jgi:AcrR family transcriptional regulator
MSIGQEPLVEAAIRVIQRYGIRRTTMHDVAAEAGVSRQTLYTVFSNKEALLRGTVRLIADRSIDAIERGCDGTMTLSAQLDVVFRELAVRPYQLVHTSPEANDIVEGLTAACAEEVRDAGQRSRALIARLLAPYDASLRAANMSADGFADFLQTALSGLKKLARDEAHLHASLETLKHMVLVLLRA